MLRLLRCINCKQLQSCGRVSHIKYILRPFRVETVRLALKHYIDNFTFFLVSILMANDKMEKNAYFPERLTPSN